MITERQTSTHPSARRPRPIVWHMPATDADDQAARSGGPWRTRCGVRSAPHNGPRPARKAGTLAPIERCVVCLELGRSTRS